MHSGSSPHALPSWKDHPLRQNLALAAHPTYADEFHCIGSACEDTCCQGWTVPIDQATWEKYQQLPESNLSSLIHGSIVRTDEPPNPEKSHVFATIRMNAENQCPLLTRNRLCSIQAEVGEQMLSHTCHTYPRIVHSFGGICETALALSCPEAARLVLLAPNLRTPTPPNPAVPAFANGANPLPPDFWAIRTTLLTLLRNAAYPLWQRLFLLSILCQRLDAIGRGELKVSVLDFLAGFQDSVAGGTLRAAMQSLPIDPTAQVDIVLRLAGLMLHKSNIRPRFVECIQAFTTGIGNGPGSTLQSLTAHYNFAHDRYFQPFIERHPYILENYLINTILRCQFPYGKEGMVPGAEPRMSKEFALLTAQFTLIKGLLIGVAGFHREQFAAKHVIHTVQAAAKHFEHHPEFLSNAHTLLVESRMDGARGMAILLRNASQGTASGQKAPLSPSLQTQPPQA
jgi:lysine-N-methylase